MNWNFNEPKKVYLVFGEEKYQIRLWEKQLLSTVTDPSTAMLNHNIFDGKSAVENIIDACNTLPFMSSYRVVTVKDSKLFSTGRKNDTQAMTEYISQIPENTILYFIEEKVDKRNTLYKAVKKYGECVELSLLKENELIDWCIKVSDNRLNKGTATLLIRNVGAYMEALEGEINKLLQFVSPTEKITPEHINQACTVVPEAKIFDMVAAIGDKNTEKALDIYNNMLEAKESPFGILKMISRQFKLILECKYLAKKGYNNESISQEIGVHSFIVRNCLTQGKNFSNKALLAAIKDCFDCDINIKSGKISDKLGVELIILKYSQK